MTQTFVSQREDPATIARVRQLFDKTDLSTVQAARALSLDIAVVTAICQGFEAEKKAKQLAADRYKIAEGKRKLHEARKRAKNKSLNWARPTPEQGNLVSAWEVRRIRDVHKAAGAARRSLTAAMLGDPEPHHIEIRRQRAEDATDISMSRLLNERARQTGQINANRSLRIGKQG